MPYKFGGRLSSGCERCRQKRVKCDEAKPRCIRCSKSDSPCKYRDFDELVFRDETKETAVRAKRQWRSRVLSDGYESDLPSDSGLSKLSKSTTLDELDSAFTSDLDGEISPSPQSAILEPLLDQARKRFFYDFVFPGDPKTFRAAYLDFVPRLTENAPVDSCLALAVDALSLANFSKRRASPEANSLAMQVYGRAMNATNAAIADPVLCRHNSTLVASSLLTMFELICGPFGYLEHYHSHSDGCLALLKHRGWEDFTDSHDFAVFRFVYGSELLRCLRFGRHPLMPAVPSEMRRIFPYSQGRLLKVISEVANVLADLLEAKKAGGVHDVAASILSRALILNAALQTWHKTQPPWFIVSVTFVQDEDLSPWLKELLTGEDAPDKFYRHYNSTVGALTSFYQFARLRTQQLIARTALELDDQERFSASLTEITGIIEYMCSSVGSLFNDSIGLKEGGREDDWETQGVRTHIGLRSILMPAYSAMLVPWVQNTQVQKYLPFVERLLEDFRERWHLWAPHIADCMAW